MAIALERYLIPMISKNQQTSYNLALIRICTTLTKGWFRQFAIDNYPRISNLNKKLLSIAYDIIGKHSLIKQKNSQKSILDPETQALFDYIHSYTKTLPGLEDCYENNCSVSKSGIKIISPVNHNISITAIITNAFHLYTEDICNPHSYWTTSVVILPSNEFELISSDYVEVNKEEYEDYEGQG